MSTQSLLSVPRQRPTSKRDEESQVERTLPHPPSQSTLTSPGEITRSWTRFIRKKVGVLESLKAIAFSSCLNIFLVFIPFAWVAHFMHWHHGLTFAFCFLALLPLSKLSEYGGEQLSFYLGKDLGDFFAVSLNNVIEATLAIILLKKCEIRLLQSTVIGVVILHLLLIPGTAFFTGGAHIMEQELHPHLSQLNHVLLTIGVLTLLLPSAFFTATDRLVDGSVDESTRIAISHMSRGLAIILLTVYLCSRVYLYNPPGHENSLHQHPLAPEALKEEEHHLATIDPEVNQWVCLGMLTVTIGVIAATAEWLVDSIEPLREDNGIPEEWFGLVLLPLVSFSADGVNSATNFLRRQFGGVAPTTLAKAQAIDMSIQFIIFWLPLFVLIGWWTNKPMIMLFDLFEVVIVVAACFILNYVTADAKTNYAEGYALVAFYVMIALCSWFYHGQHDVEELLLCIETPQVA